VSLNSAITGISNKSFRESRGEKKENFDVLDIARLWIESCDHIISEFFRLLFGVGITLVYVKYVALAVVFES